ncbi:hypothetical protein WJX73_010927 [Symbiochloris irregularis]|uniref:Cysteine dioxygenase n=1 Tax=Symbiochloris irregularis TaxID=706552 RepID=A0AAW1P649_9CHLO
MVCLESQPDWQGSFPVVAGGLVTFTMASREDFCVSIKLAGCASEFCKAIAGAWLLVLHVHKQGASIVLKHRQELSDSVEDFILATTSDKAAGVHPGLTSYWLSLDVKGMVHYGQGYHMEETTMLSCCLCGNEDLGIDVASIKLLASHAKLVRLHAPQLDAPLQAGSSHGAVTFERCPLTHNPPPIIKPSSGLCLLDLGWQQGIPSCCLPSPCKVLYEQLSSPAMTLDHLPSLHGTLREAIRHSLATPGALLHTAVKAKAGRRFAGGPSKQCYIRVGVSRCRGLSPGEPFVLEIWPSGHFSPVHNHGLAFGVTRVLHGSITVRVFNKHLHREKPQQLQQHCLQEGQLTWFSPNWYQTHQLDNQTDDFCCTLNGFQYGQDDGVCWPFMTCKGQQPGDVHEFEAVSDFEFSELRVQLLEELRLAKARAFTCAKVARCDSAQDNQGHLARTTSAPASPGTPDMFQAAHASLCSNSKKPHLTQPTVPSAAGFVIAG